MSVTTQTTFNDALVEMDNLLKGLNMLYEEIQTRKDTIVQAIDVQEKVRNEMETSRFKSQIVEYIRNEYGTGLYREVAYMVMEEIDKDIEAFINLRVNEALQRAGVAVSSEIPAPSTGTAR